MEKSMEVYGCCLFEFMSKYLVVDLTSLLASRTRERWVRC